MVEERFDRLEAMLDREKRRSDQNEQQKRQ